VDTNPGCNIVDFQILPGLQSFCISCAIAIASIFLLQTSWFVAFLALDEKRIEEKRNGLIPCISHEKWKPSKWSQSGMTTQMIAIAVKMYKIKLTQVIESHNLVENILFHVSTIFL
jgi:hypothetical protein